MHNLTRKAFVVIVIIGAVGAILGMSISRWLRSQSSNTRTICDETDIPGQIVVGFTKNITSQEAEKLFTDAGLTYIQTGDVNLGKDFFYKTGLKYIVTVVPKQEYLWIEKFSKNSLVVQANCHPDPTKITVD